MQTYNQQLVRLVARRGKPWRTFAIVTTRGLYYRLPCRIVFGLLVMLSTVIDWLTCIILDVFFWKLGFSFFFFLPCLPFMPPLVLHLYLDSLFVLPFMSLLVLPFMSPLVLPLIMLSVSSYTSFNAPSCSSRCPFVSLLTSLLVLPQIQSDGSQGFNPGRDYNPYSKITDASKIGFNTDARLQQAARQQIHAPPLVQQQQHLQQQHLHQTQQHHLSIATAFKQRNLSTPYTSEKEMSPINNTTANNQHLPSVW